MVVSVPRSWGAGEVFGARDGDIDACGGQRPVQLAYPGGLAADLRERSLVQVAGGFHRGHVDGDLGEGVFE